MKDAPLPWLDLETSRRKAAALEQKRTEAIENLEARLAEAAEKKRDFRKLKGQTYATLLDENSATAAKELAALAAADAEFDSELADGMVVVAKELLEQAKEAVWSLRHFSDRSDSIERWGGAGNTG